MSKSRALVYVDRLYHCADGKTAHGLVRYSKRFEIVSVVDTTLPNQDAGTALDGITRGIPLFNALSEAVASTHPDTFIIGAVTEGSVLPEGYYPVVEWALSQGLHVVSGLHQFLSDDAHLMNLAEEHDCTITDVRKMFRDYKRFYSGEIARVQSTRIAMIGTDSAIGKRTVAVSLNEKLNKKGRSSDMIYTGQTGWMQGWPHGTVIDAMVGDFIAGGIEGAILDSWNEDKPEFMIIEGQGSLVHPFFPGGFEILAAGQIHGFILVDAPGRPHLDGFPGYPMPDPKRVVQIAELLTDRSLSGVSLNSENLMPKQIDTAKQKLMKLFNVPVVDPLQEGVGTLVDVLEELRDGK